MAFSADWLTLREPADHAARSKALTRRLVEQLATSGAGADVSVLDLGSGTGSNLRYLEPHLPATQHWTLLDHDADLLRAAAQRIAVHAEQRGLTCAEDLDGALRLRGHDRACDITRRQQDLSRSLDAIGLPSSGSLVTGAALLDLVSERWLQQLAALCQGARAVVLFTLTYDGRIACEPPDADDAFVHALVNEHQHGDKGFDAAAGPDATRLARACFERVGYQVLTEPSDWVLDADAGELQRQLIEGWAAAATELASAEASRITAWRTRRIEDVDAGRSRIRVGHQDLAAWPSDARS
jgi:SAM-dependent methyltransferase